MHPLRHWLRRRIAQLLGLLRQGVSPQRLALCVAIGIVVGNIPIMGVSTALCTAIALLFRLNLPAIQLVQASMAPTQLLLIVPFVRLGEWLMRAPPQAVSVNSGIALLSQGVLHAIGVLREAIVHAGVAWLLVAPPATWLLYRILTPIFSRTALRMAGAGNDDDSLPTAGSP